MIRSALIAVLLLVQTTSALAEEHCRRVQLTGSVGFIPVPKSGFRGTVNAPEGKFKIELLFRENGAEPIKQRNFIELTNINSHAFGGATQCVITLPEAARGPRAFTVSAELLPDTVVTQYGSDPKEHVTDQLDFSVQPLPPLAPITLTTQCAGGKPAQLSDFGASYNQLLLPLATRRYSNSIKLNQGRKDSGPGEIEVPGGRARIAWDDLETMVPCSKFE